MAVTTIKELLVRYTGDTKGLEQSTERAKATISSFSRTTKGGFDSLSERTKVAESRLRDMALAGQQNTQAFKRLQARTEEYRGRLDAANASVRRGAGEMATMTTKVKSMAIALAPFAAAFAAFQSIKLADTFVEIETKLGNVTKTAEDAKRVFGELFDIAQRDGAKIDGLADAYVKLNISLRDSVKDSTDLVKVTELLSRGFAAAGTSAGTAAGATLQLTQGLATDFKAAGQELNSIIEGAPLLAKVISEQLGGNAATDLKRFAEDGRLTADIFLKALIASENAIKSFEIPNTISRSVQRLKNEILLSVGAFNSATGASSGLADVVSSIAAQMELFRRVTLPLIQKSFELLVLRIKKLLRGVSEEYDDFVKKQKANIQILSRGLIKFNRDLPTDGFTPIPEDFDGQISQVEREMRKIISSYQSMGDESEKTKLALEEEIEVALSRWREEQAGQEGAAEAEKRKKRGIKETAAALEEVRRKQEELANSTADTLADMASSFDDLRSVAVRALQDILKNLLRIQFGGTASGGLFGTLATGLAGAFSLGGFTVPGTGSGTTITDAGIPVPGTKPKRINFATGGSFMVRGTSGTDRNVLSLNNQPIANVSKGERVNVSNSGGGVNVTQNININAGVQGTVAAEIQRFLPEFKKLSIDAVQDAQNRGKMRQ